MKRLLSLLVCAFFVVSIAKANNVSVSDVSYTALNSGTQYEITFSLSWDNAWRIDGGSVYQDAVWIFVKYKIPSNPIWQHLKLAAGSSGTSGEISYSVTADQIGAFVSLNTDKVGDVNSTSITLTSDILPTPSTEADIKVYAIEMVKVPQGNFWAGDGTSTSKYGRMPGNDREAIEITGTDLFAADVDGNNTSVFANTESFYCMKYEITNEQYVAFLNALTLPQQDALTYLDLTQPLSTSLFQDATPGPNNVIMARSKSGENTIPQEPVSVSLSNGANETFNEFEDGTELPVGYLDPLRLLRYLDWAGLRSLSALEYEKVCRGFNLPSPGEFAWGTAEIDGIVLEDTALTAPFRAAVTDANVGDANQTGNLFRSGITATAQSNSRYLSSASYFGILDLTGNIAELTFNVDKDFYQPFLTVGDGNLNPDGTSDVETAAINQNGSITFFPKGGSFTSIIPNQNTLNAISVSGTPTENAPIGSYTASFGGRGVRDAD